MQVYLIPVETDRYELYYEQTTDLEADIVPPPSGPLGKLQHQFAALLRAAELHDERRRERTGTPDTWASRLQDRLLSWVAERIVEQRLLWNLRKQTAVVAVHPQDAPFEQVLAHIHRNLERDYDRHRFWLVLNAIALVISGAFAIIPGPNLLAYYFLFRVGGHWLSMRGASQGRHRVTWTSEPSRWLDELRAARSGPARLRRERIAEIAAELHLRNLPVFFDRLAGLREADARRAPGRPPGSGHARRGAGSPETE